MALVLGTNCGFVTVAPTDDPNGGISIASGYAKAFKDIAPVGAIKVTEIGWWCESATEEANFEVGIYDHNIGDDEPENVVGTLSQTNAKGTTAGWKRVTGLNIPITAGDIYWIAAQLDATATVTYTNVSSATAKYVWITPATTLPDPWGTPSGELTTYLLAHYAVWEAAGPETFTKQFDDTVTVTDTFTRQIILARSFSDTVTITDDFSPIYIKSPIILSDTVTITDDFDIQKSVRTYTIQIGDTVTITDIFSTIFMPTIFTQSISDDVTITDTLALTRVKPPKPLPVVTKLVIAGKKYDKIISMVVDRSMGDYNTTSNFQIIMPNQIGQFNDTFNLNDDVTIYADQTTGVPTTKIFRGIIEKLTYKGKGQKETLRLRGRDYGAILQDIIVSPRVFKDIEASKIVETLLIQNITNGQVTWNSVTVTDTTIDRITFNNISVFDAIQRLAELSVFYFFVYEDKDLHFVEKDSISSGFTFDNTNITQANFKTDDSEIFNKVTVYGDRQLTGVREEFVAQAGSVYTLEDKPSNIVVTGSAATNVILQPGGILSVDNPAYESVQYLVDYQLRNVVLTSGAVAGDNTGWIGSSVIIDYQRSSPLVSIKQDATSQTAYGHKHKVIIDRNIKEISESSAKADAFLADHKDPKIQGNINVRGTLKVNPGDTCIVHIPYHNVHQTYKVLNAKYNFTLVNNLNSNVLSLIVNKKIADVTDTTKDVLLRLKKLEGAEVDASITDIQTTTESVTAEISAYNAISRSIGSAFYFHVSNHDILNSPSSLLGDMRAGSQVISYP